MADYGKGFIVSKSELHNSEYGMNTNHWNGNVTSFLNHTTHKGQLTDKENAIHIMMGLGTFYPGGGIEEHYHVYADDVPVFDHAYYVISGKIKAVIGDQVRIVGHDSLLYCPSNVKHSITNVGKTPAKVLRVSACNEAARMGDAVWTTWVPNGPAHEKVEVKKRVRKTAARK
jgi:quercetin dioxygenase-like cupin family protein